MTNRPLVCTVENPRKWAVIFQTQGRWAAVGKFDNFYSYPEKKDFCSNRKWYLCSILSSPTSNNILVLYVVVFVVSFFSGQPYAKMQLASSRRVSFSCLLLLRIGEVLPQWILTWPFISSSPFSQTALPWELRCSITTTRSSISKLLFFARSSYFLMCHHHYYVPL